jgi:hypothetical protein
LIVVAPRLPGGTGPESGLTDVASFPARRGAVTPGDARRYAAAFDREDRDDFGLRAPVSLFPVRLARRAKRR